MHATPEPGSARAVRPWPPEPVAGEVEEVRTPSYVPTRVLFGEGCAGSLPEVVAERHRPGDRVLVLTGRQGPAKPWLADLLDAIRRFAPDVVEAAQPNPTVASIERVLAHARRQRPALVVAVGGGSVLDTGKAVALLARGGADVRAGLAGRTGGDPIPLIALPTTSGTGAEVTRTATVWDDREPRKHALDHPGLFPETALVDPHLAASAPAGARVSAGLDALSQAAESAWSVRSTPESIAYSLRAAALAAGSIERACRDPGDRAARARLSLASLYAGMALARARTTLAHAISYPLTARYGLPHGYACALTLGALLRCNAAVRDEDCTDPRGPAHVRAVVARVQEALGAGDAAAAERRIERLIAALGLPPLGAHGHVRLEIVADDVASYDRSGNNPRALDRAAVLRLLRTAAQGSDPRPSPRSSASGSPSPVSGAGGARGGPAGRHWPG